MTGISDLRAAVAEYDAAIKSNELAAFARAAVIDTARALVAAPCPECDLNREALRRVCSDLTPRTWRERVRMAWRFLTVGGPL
jgi:hypothetical protein